MLFSFECGGWFWRRDAEIALLKSADVRLPRGPAAKEMRRLLLEAMLHAFSTPELFSSAHVWLLGRFESH